MPRTRRGRRRIAAPEFAFALCVLQVQLLEAKTEPKEQDGEEDGELENAFEHLYQCVLERSYVGVHRRERQQVDEREQEAEAVEAEWNQDFVNISTLDVFTCLQRPNFFFGETEVPSQPQNMIHEEHDHHEQADGVPARRELQPQRLPPRNPETCGTGAESVRLMEDIRCDIDRQADQPDKYEPIWPKKSNYECNERQIFVQGYVYTLVM